MYFNDNNLEKIYIRMQYLIDSLIMFLSIFNVNYFVIINKGFIVLLTFLVLMYLVIKSSSKLIQFYL